MISLEAQQLLSAATPLDYHHAAAVAAAAAAANSAVTADDVTAGGVSGALDLPSAKRRRFEAPTATQLYYSPSAAAAYH